MGVQECEQANHSSSACCRKIHLIHKCQKSLPQCTWGLWTWEMALSPKCYRTTVFPLQWGIFRQQGWCCVLKVLVERRAMEQRGTWVLQPPGTLSYRENQLLQERQGKGPGWKWCVLLDPWLPNQVESSCGCRGWLHIGLCMNMASDGAQLERGCLYTAAWAKRT